MSDYRLAIVYDWANQIGGAERVLEAIRQIWPQATLFTSIYHSQKATWVKKFSSVKTSFLNQLPGIKTHHRFFAPFFPLAFEQFCFDDYDLVISITSGPAKAIITSPKTCHICYCLTPYRQFWQRQFLNSSKLFASLTFLRSQDYFLAQRPDYFLAISHYVAQRIEEFYRRKAEVVYPGVDLTKFQPESKKENNKKNERRNYFLVVSRLVGYKKIDLVIRVFNHLGWRLKIIGEGREEKKLKKLAKDNIVFLGRVSDDQLIKEYQNCQAVIFPQEEDFGLVPIEAQACGRPVIAFARGGAQETIIPGKTGEFFYQQTEESLINLLKGFNPAKYKKEDCFNNARKFNLKKFMLLFKNEVEERLVYYQRKRNNQ